MKDLKELSITELEDVLKTYPWFSIARQEMFKRMCCMGEDYRKDAIKKAVVYVFASAVITNKCLETEEKEKPVEISFMGLSSGNKPLSIDLDEEKSVTEEENKSFSIDNDPITIDNDPITINTNSISIDNEPTFLKNHPFETNTNSAPRRKNITIDTAKDDKKIYIVGGDYFSNADFDELKKTGNSVKEVINKRKFQDTNSAPVIYDASNFKDQSYYTETLARIYAEQELYAKSIAIYEKLILQYPKKNVYFASLIDELMKHI